MSREPRPHEHPRSPARMWAWLTSINPLKGDQS